MLKAFIKKACGKRRVIAPKVMVCIPSQATEVEKRAVVDATINSGAITLLFPHAFFIKALSIFSVIS